MTDDRATAQGNELARGRLYEQVAEAIVRQIADGGFAIDERLPAERELAVAHRVSRATIREAIVSLETRGLVDVRVGSGVYVKAIPTLGDLPVTLDVGPFELVEARLLIEGEAAALAAALITSEELAALDALLVEMEAGNKRGNGESADRGFHLAVARATRNNALASVVESLWAIRDRSPQCVRLFKSSKLQGYLPVVAEHRAIADALRARQPEAARRAMQDHLRRVLNYLLDASEQEALEETRARMHRRRQRYGAGIRPSGA